MIILYLLFIDIALRLLLQGTYISLFLCVLLLQFLFDGNSVRFWLLMPLLCVQSLLSYDRLGFDGLYIIPVFFLILAMRYLLYMRWWYCYVPLLTVLGIKIVILEHWFLGLPWAPQYVFWQICANIAVITVISLIWQRRGISSNRTI